MNNPSEIAQEIAPTPSEFLNSERPYIHDIQESYPNYVTRKEFEIGMNQLRTEMNQLRTDMNEKFNELFRILVAKNKMD